MCVCLCVCTFFGCVCECVCVILRLGQSPSYTHSLISMNGVYALLDREKECVCVRVCEWVFPCVCVL